jgi:hypothetical protein
VVSQPPATRGKHKCPPNQCHEVTVRVPDRGRPFRPTGHPPGEDEGRVRHFVGRKAPAAAPRPPAGRVNDQMPDHLPARRVVEHVNALSCRRTGPWTSTIGGREPESGTFEHDGGSDCSRSGLRSYFAHSAGRASWSKFTESPGRDGLTAEANCTTVP